MAGEYDRLKRAFIDRDPTVVDECFGANYKQHNPRIADGPSAIAKMIPTLSRMNPAWPSRMATS